MPLALPISLVDGQLLSIIHALRRVQKFFVRVLPPFVTTGSLRASWPRCNQRCGIDDQRAVPAVDAGAPLGRLDEPPQDGRDSLRTDRQLERGEPVITLVSPLLLLVCRWQAVGVNDDAACFDARVAGDGGGDDLALDLQGFALGVDEPAVVLAEIEDAADHDAEAGKIGDEDAAQQAAGDEAHGRRATAMPAKGRVATKRGRGSRSGSPCRPSTRYARWRPRPSPSPYRYSQQLLEIAPKFERHQSSAHYAEGRSRNRPSARYASLKR